MTWTKTDKIQFKHYINILLELVLEFIFKTREGCNVDIIDISTHATRKLKYF